MVDHPLLLKPPRFYYLDSINSKTDLGLLLNREYSTDHGKQVLKFVPENDWGDTEYKWKLVNPTYDRILHLTT